MNSKIIIEKSKAEAFNCLITALIKEMESKGVTIKDKASLNNFKYEYDMTKKGQLYTIEIEVTTYQEGTCYAYTATTTGTKSTQIHHIAYTFDEIDANQCQLEFSEEVVVSSFQERLQYLLLKSAYKKSIKHKINMIKQFIEQAE